MGGSGATRCYHSSVLSRYVINRGDVYLKYNLTDDNTVATMVNIAFVVMMNRTLAELRPSFSVVLYQRSESTHRERDGTNYGDVTCLSTGSTILGTQSAGESKYVVHRCYRLSSLTANACLYTHTHTHTHK